MTATAYEHGSSRAYVDPYAVDDTALPKWDRAGRREGEADYLLPAPDPAQRLAITLDPRDLRRLELQAALTTAGIPPLPDDREAIDQLSALPGSINATLQRWLHHTI
ncbi:hypothetical protein ACFV0T_26980 [Streptomyces sp. NPDC059582]|uniref:hypothetical protein n=1 Tax=Streptomyces sp. NPDC059582 TaxID=3346875 RepID=UPI00369F6263